MELRPYRDGDAPGCAAIFDSSVHEGAATHYSAVEREAWAPSLPRTVDAKARWAARLADQITWVAEQDGALVGFFSLHKAGHLDLAFVLPEQMGTGLAGRLYDRIEAEARARHLARLTTEASHLARPFLARRGWQLEAEQQVDRDGVLLTNFRMWKELD